MKLVSKLSKSKLSKKEVYLPLILFLVGCLSLASTFILEFSGSRFLSATMVFLVISSLVFSFLAYKFVAPRIGRFTAVALMAVFWAIAFFVVAFLSPSCPGAAPGPVSRCTASELGSWLLIGALIPVMWGVLLIPPFSFYRSLRLLGKKLRLKYKSSSLIKEPGKSFSKKADSPKTASPKTAFLSTSNLNTADTSLQNTTEGKSTKIKKPLRGASKFVDTASDKATASKPASQNLPAKDNTS